MKKSALLLLLTLSTLMSVAQNKKYHNAKHLKELVTIMQGSYTSQKQAQIDTSYFNISLKMVPIWKDRGHFLYVEQALATKQDKPYRVRIYKVVQTGKRQFASEIYTLKNEKDYIGKWNNPTAFDQLSTADITLKPGCEVRLQRIKKNKFMGQTGDKTCPSELRGASYATSKVTVLPNQIVSWDQGFDTNGKQVWGAEKGGYIFDKI